MSKFEVGDEVVVKEIRSDTPWDFGRKKYVGSRGTVIMVSETGQYCYRVAFDPAYATDVYAQVDFRPDELILLKDGNRVVFEVQEKEEDYIKIKVSEIGDILQSYLNDRQARPFAELILARYTEYLTEVLNRK